MRSSEDIFRSIGKLRDKRDGYIKKLEQERMIRGKNAMTADDWLDFQNCVNAISWLEWVLGVTARTPDGDKIMAYWCQDHGDYSKTRYCTKCI